jgi:hypothetical protein
MTKNQKNAPRTQLRDLTPAKKTATAYRRRPLSAEALDQVMGGCYDQGDITYACGACYNDVRFSTCK